MVAFRMECNSFDEDKDVNILVKYPEIGIGKIIINYVRIVVFQVKI